MLDFSSSKKSSSSEKNLSRKFYKIMVESPGDDSYKNLPSATRSNSISIDSNMVMKSFTAKLAEIELEESLINQNKDKSDEIRPLQ